MSKESTHASRSPWFLLPAQVRHYLIKNFLSYSDASALAFTRRHAMGDMDVCLGQMMCTGEVVNFHPEGDITLDKLVAGLPDYWQLSHFPRLFKDAQTRLALTILKKAPVRWLAIYLNQLSLQKPKKQPKLVLFPRKSENLSNDSDFQEETRLWTPWDWVSIAAAMGRTDHLQYLLYRWQIYSLDCGEYKLTLPEVSLGSFLKSHERLETAYVYKATPLQIATFQKQTKVIELLAEYGKIDFAHEKDQALIIAVTHNSLELVRQLVNRGANPNFYLYHTIYSFSPYLLAIRTSRLEILRYFKTLNSVCVWQEMEWNMPAYDIMYAPGVDPQVRVIGDPPTAKYKRFGYGLIGTLIGILLSPFIVLAQNLHAIAYTVNFISSNTGHYILSRLLTIGMACVFGPIILAMNLLSMPLIGLVTGFRIGWRYRQKAVFDLACYVKKSASTLSNMLNKLSLFSRHTGNEIYVTNAPEYYYLSFGAILTGTLTLLAALNVFSPLTLIFPALTTWPAWQVIGLTAVAAIVLATSLCQLVDAIRYERDNARLLKKAADRQKPDTLLDEKTLYERLHPTQEQREDHRTCHRSVSVFDQAPVLKQAADGQLVQLGQLTI